MCFKFNSRNRLNVKNKYVKITLCRHGRIELTERTCRGVARICKGGFAVFLALEIKLFKAFFRHKHLTAHFKTFNGNVGF